VNLFATVIEIVAPVFLLAGLGFAWVQAGFEYRLEFVSNLAMSVAVPTLIFVSLMQSKLEPSALGSILLATVAAYAALTALVWIGVKLLKKDTSIWVSPIIFGNTGNLGLPLALFAFGETGLNYALVILAVTSVWAFTFGVWLVAGGGSIWKAVKEPMVAATLLGALFLWQGWQTPQFLTNALGLIAQMAIPLMLITLGVAVARLSPNRLGLAFQVSVLKVAISVVIAWIIGKFFNLDPVAFGVLVMQIGTPVAVTSYLVAAKYGKNAEDIAGLVVASTLLSIGYLPLLLAFLLP